MAEFKISPRAYTKIIFHAAKYPHCAVNGILLAEKESSKGKSVHIIDAIPLFHQCLHVTPMAEIALIEIEALATAEGQQIAGYYAAPENFYDSTIDKIPGLKIADKIAENGSNACLILVDNKLVCMNSDKPAIKVWQNVESRWSKAGFTLEQSMITLDAVSSLLQRGAMKDLIDFDNHLDNPVYDWRNKFLNRDLEQIMAMY